MPRNMRVTSIERATLQSVTKKGRDQKVVRRWWEISSYSNCFPSKLKRGTDRSKSERMKGREEEELWSVRSSHNTTKRDTLRERCEGGGGISKGKRKSFGARLRLFCNWQYIT